jgi:type I restriction enzyme M protein
MKPDAAPPTDAQVQSQIVNFLWAIAELLRDAFRKSDNQNVILPFTVLRRLDYALEPTKQKVLELNARLTAKGLENRHDALCRASGYAFYNVCPLNYDAILDDPAHLQRNLQHCVAGFSENVQEIFRRFKFDDVLRDLEQVGRLYAVMEKFNEKSKINLRPRSEDNPGGLTNHQMGTVFEQLIRRFNEAINENPGEHFTPRDVIHLLVSLVLAAG